MRWLVPLLGAVGVGTLFVLTRRGGSGAGSLPGAKAGGGGGEVTTAPSPITTYHPPPGIVTKHPLPLPIP